MYDPSRYYSELRRAKQEQAEAQANLARAWREGAMRVIHSSLDETDAGYEDYYIQDNPYLKENEEK